VLKVGHPEDAAAAFAELLLQPVGADPVSSLLLGQSGHARRRSGRSGHEPRKQQRLDALHERLRRRSLREAGPLHGLELGGHMRLGVARRVDYDRNQEGPRGGHRMRAFGGELPLEPHLRVGGDDGNEQGAVVDLVPDLPVPSITAHEFALIEPHFDARALEGIEHFAGGSTRIAVPIVGATHNASSHEHNEPIHHLARLRLKPRD
jgi:hypothetical protein